MAGDWIKMRVALSSHPKVVRITSALKADRLRTVGGLHAVWGLFDAHSEDGRLDGYSVEALDSFVGWPGFTQALADVDWLEIGENFLSLPEFDGHNGKSAKRRAQETERKRNDRKLSAPQADKKRTREEKRRDKPIVLSAHFQRFWAAWPKSNRKGGQAKCYEVWVKGGFDEIADAIIAHVEAMKLSIDWRKNNGEFIPAPLPYLNGRKWDGAEAPTAEPRRAAV